MRSALLFTAALAVVSTVTSGHARAESLDDLLARNLAARGGAKNLSAIRSLRRTGKVLFGRDGSTEAAWGEVVVRPGKRREETSMQGLTAVEGFDGATGWTVSPFGGRQDAELAAADDVREMSRHAELDGPLFPVSAGDRTISLLGREDVDGTLAYKLRVTRRHGDLQYVYLDPDTALEIRVTTVRQVRGTEERREVDLGDYRQVAGVWLPFTADAGDPGEPRTSHIVVERVEVNVDVDPAAFRVPAAGVRAGRVVIAGPTASAGTIAGAPAAADRHVTFDRATLSGLGARNIGSAAMSGRVAAVAAIDSGGATTVYVGAASGGVWRSRDGGTTFKPVFDRNPVQSIGSIAIDPSRPSRIWVGTGEVWTRNSVSIGDGIYRSDDGGENWTHMGLAASERIARILVHPTRGDTVYACVPGKLWSDSKDRGVYRTRDGGAHWTLVLPGANLSTGCSGLAMDPRNPDVLFAGMWDFRRKGWTFRSGGDGPDAPSGSGLYRTADGGTTWTALTARGNRGIPAGPWGRVEVAIAPSNPKIVYAFIESKASALYRSSDGGATWEARDRSFAMVWRPFYFARLVVDPTNPDRLFKPDLDLIVSEDGGKSFASTGGGSHGDWHDLWIDPKNPRHVIGGDDGGLWLSYDGGGRWWKSNNLPISQFYHVSVDDHDPYRVYGGLQDNSSWVGPSAAPGGITNAEWQNLFDSDGFWTLVDPTDPEAVYAEGQGGYVGRVDRRTMARRDIQPLAGYGEKLRFNWNTPLHLSPTHKGTLYIGAQFLFRSRDRGVTWERISPDLTTNDPAKQQQERSGGVTVDNSSAEMHTTIYSISESPRDGNLIWVGTDDGNLQLTRDGGRHWTNVVGNVAGLPPHSWVSWVEASRFDAATAYAAFDRHTFGDMDPWVFRTQDYGRTWTRIVAPTQGVRGYAHVIKEDVVSRSLLFLGTEFGLWISIDGGAQWAELKAGELPSVAVREVQIQPRERDLVIATHGRGIWIVDDLSPLRALSPAVLAQSTAFLPGRPVQQRMPSQGGWVEGDATFVGPNPAAGAQISYYLRGPHLFGPIKLEVLDGKGAVIDTIVPTKHRGINRVTWSMRARPPQVPRAAQVAESARRGPRLPPGTYRIRLTRGSEVLETKLVIGVDRRAPYSAAERTAQYHALMKAHALFGDMTRLTERLDGVRAEVADRLRGLPASDALARQLRAVDGKLEALKKRVVATTEGGAITGEERLREHLDIVYGAMLTWEGRPTPYQTARVEVLRRELTEVSKTFDGVIAHDVRGLDAALRQHRLAPVPVAAVERDEQLDPDAARCVASFGRACDVDEERAGERD